MRKNKNINYYHAHNEKNFLKLAELEKTELRNVIEAKKIVVDECKDNLAQFQEKHHHQIQPEKSRMTPQLIIGGVLLGDFSIASFTNSKLNIGLLENLAISAITAVAVWIASKAIITLVRSMKTLDSIRKTILYGMIGISVGGLLIIGNHRYFNAVTQHDSFNVIEYALSLCIPMLIIVITTGISYFLEPNEETVRFLNLKKKLQDALSEHTQAVNTLNAKEHELTMQLDAYQRCLHQEEVARSKGLATVKSTNSFLDKLKGKKNLLLLAFGLGLLGSCSSPPSTPDSVIEIVDPSTPETGSLLVEEMVTFDELADYFADNGGTYHLYTLQPTIGVEHAHIAFPRVSPLAQLEQGKHLHSLLPLRDSLASLHTQISSLSEGYSTSSLFAPLSRILRNYANDSSCMATVILHTDFLENSATLNLTAISYRQLQHNIDAIMKRFNTQCGCDDLSNIRFIISYRSNEKEAHLNAHRILMRSAFEDFFRSKGGHIDLHF